MKKDFDCVDMKRKIQDEIYEETKDLTRDEQLEHLHKAAERFERKIEKLRKKKPAGPKKRTKKTAAPK
jgi:cell division protein ZapA (FtsZ GTPase activity inhibitor)